MNSERTPQFLPALMGTLRQDANDGVLTLEQSDGVRNLYWVDGNLVYLKSEIGGEQFGNYLIRQGVLDVDALNELLADTQGSRFGDRLVKWGLLSEKERDQHLYNLMRQILLHAMEHPIHTMKWSDAPVGGALDLDLYFPLDYRRMVWETFQDLANLSDVCQLFSSTPDWRWEAPPDLLESLKDLPLTPQMAYTLTFLGKEPMGFETLASLTGMAEEETARLIVTLWAFGGLNLSKGQMPSPARKAKQVLTPPMVPVLNTPMPRSSTRFEVPPRSYTPPPLPPPPAPQPPAPPPPRVEPPHAMVHIDLETSPNRLEFPAEEEAEAESADEFDGGGELPSDSGSQPAPQQNAMRLFRKAKHLLLQNRTSETVRLLEESVRLDPEGPCSYDAWLLLGRIRLANPAWAKRAMDALQTANRLRPKAGEPFALMGELYHRKGFKVEAARSYRTAIELNPLLNIPSGVDMTAADPEPEPPKPDPTVWERLRSIFTPAEKS